MNSVGHVITAFILVCSKSAKFYVTAKIKVTSAKAKCAVVGMKWHLTGWSIREGYFWIWYGCPLDAVVRLHSFLYKTSASSSRMARHCSAALSRRSRKTLASTPFPKIEKETLHIVSVHHRWVSAGDFTFHL